ncbi:hypothetical protein ACCO45_013636 [Purpureocillium lilacinum]|uniref:Uncharacterized protein n=1 Tax=Purpureocillium lilacinum TaxID=33203 RepID=A0ACC4D6U6_PURLI
MDGWIDGRRRSPSQRSRKGAGFLGLCLARRARHGCSNLDIFELRPSFPILPFLFSSAADLSALPAQPAGPCGEASHLVLGQQPLDRVVVPRQVLVAAEVVHEAVARAAQPGHVLQVLAAVPAALDGLFVHEARDQVVVRQRDPGASAELARLCPRRLRCGRRRRHGLEVRHQDGGKERLRRGRERRVGRRVRRHEPVRDERLWDGRREVQRRDALLGQRQRELCLQRLRLAPGSVVCLPQALWEAVEDAARQVVDKVGQFLGVLLRAGGGGVPVRVRRRRVRGPGPGIPCLCRSLACPRRRPCAPPLLGTASAALISCLRAQQRRREAVAKDGVVGTRALFLGYRGHDGWARCGWAEALEAAAG